MSDQKPQITQPPVEDDLGLGDPQPAEKTDWDGPPPARRSIFELFDMDQTMEQQGVVINYYEYGKFKIARAGGSNTAYTQATKKYGKPFEKRSAKNLSEDVATDMLLNIYADSIILGWEGVVWRDGKELPYTRDNVFKLMKALPELFRAIINESQKVELFRKEWVEEAAKNS